MSVVLLGSTSGSVTLQEPAVAGSTTINLPATSGTMAVLPTATSVLPEASGGTGTTTGYYGFKNRIINGAMVIDQRNAGAEVNPAVNNTYYLDRWVAISTAAGKFKIGQNAGSVTPPAGFAKYLGCTSLSAYSVGASEAFAIRQNIEGFNTADLAWGTASAASVTLSFWVRSSLTGTFGVSLLNEDVSRSYPATYTISAANTWEQKTITIAGDTTGTWLTINNIGIRVTFGMGYGSSLSGTANAWNAGTAFMPTGATSVVGTNGATFYITGVQLEKGSTATSFDYRPIGTELQLCQRYAYPIRGGLSGFGNGTTVVDAAVNFPVEMRAAPSVTQGTLVYAAFGAGGAFTQSSNSNSLPNFYTQNGGTLRFSNFTGLTASSAYILNANGATGAVTTYACILTSEL